MPNGYDSYAAAMRVAWQGWWITWPLSMRVGLGDAFDTSGRAVGSAGDLAQRGLTFAHGEPAPAADFLYDANGSVAVRFKLAGGVPEGFSALAKADAGALVEFANASSVYVVFAGVRQRGMRDTRALAGDLVRLYWNGGWTTDLVAVTDVISAEGGIVLAAATASASAELRAGATLGAGPLTMINLAGKASIARAAQVGLQWVGSEVTPFYRVVRLRRGWLNKVKQDYGPPQPGLGAGPQPVPPILVEEAQDDPDGVLEPVPAADQPSASPSKGEDADP